MVLLGVGAMRDALSLEHDLVRKPVPTFRDHARKNRTRGKAAAGTAASRVCEFFIESGAGKGKTRTTEDRRRPTDKFHPFIRPPSSVVRFSASPRRPSP